MAQENSGKLYSVTADETAFYKYGPQQGNGPDAKLPHNALMTLIRPSFGYCKVKLAETGQQGFVASEDIHLASPTLVASLTPPEPPAATPAAASSVEHFDVRGSDASSVPPPEPLPPPDLPPAGPAETPNP